MTCRGCKRSIDAPGSAEQRFRDLKHPYPGLLDEVPQIERRRRICAPIGRAIPSLLATRAAATSTPDACSQMARCRAEALRLGQMVPGRRSGCHLNDGV